MLLTCWLSTSISARLKFDANLSMKRQQRSLYSRDHIWIKESKSIFVPSTNLCFLPVRELLHLVTCNWIWGHTSNCGDARCSRGTSKLSLYGDCSWGKQFLGEPRAYRTRNCRCWLWATLADASELPLLTSWRLAENPILSRKSGDFLLEALTEPA